jgi:lysophospholipid acyltransferase (LPLAT)-like uncharacterized protein
MPKSPHSLPFWKRWLVKVIIATIRLWGKTLRFRNGSPDLAISLGYTGSRIIVFWHNRLFYAPTMMSVRGYLAGRNVYGLVSPSRDGALLTSFLEGFGVKIIRGSAHQRGVQAYREMLQKVSVNGDIVITPDGSRGPKYEFKKGAARLALSAGCPIVLVSWHTPKPWKLKSWDQFQIPKPFSKVEMKVRWIGVETVQQFVNSSDLAKYLGEELSQITID